MFRKFAIAIISIFSFLVCSPINAQTDISSEDIDSVNFYFPPNAYKFKVSSDIKNYVEELKTFINENDGFKVKLDGFAQDGSNDAWNTRVSKYRVRAVRDLLIDYGIENDRIEIEYFGKSNPISEGDSRRELAKNRRVELRILQEG